MILFVLCYKVGNVFLDISAGRCTKDLFILRFVMDTQQSQKEKRFMTGAKVLPLDSFDPNFLRNLISLHGNQIAKNTTSKAQAKTSNMWKQSAMEYHTWSSVGKGRAGMI
uniref:Uncharacterized protein n=1 Tax=Glossina pallidipes TaxID=7398 RepID=A0A1A9ZIV3_GLOPL